MNIFEALEKGNGKATVSGELNFYYVGYENGRFLGCSNLPGWLLPQEVPYSDLKRNDWIPYVPPEDRDDYIEKLVIKPYVPRGTCSNCGDAYLGKMVKLTPDWACNECGRLFKFEVMPPAKYMKKEVFENVKWYRAQWNIIYPAPIGTNQEDSNKKLLNKPPMKMTLEWEE